MDEIRELTFEELCHVVGDIASRYGMKRVYIFGSRARGDYSENSDYDFCVQPGEHCGIFRLGGFITDLKESLGHDVDLVYEDCIQDDLAKVVKEEGKLVYEE